MNLKKQKLLLEYLTSSPDTYALCSSIIKADYFDPELINTINFIQDYYEKYNSIPSNEQVNAETGVKLKQHDISTTKKLEYCTNEIEKYCKRKAIERAVLDSPALIEDGNYGQVESLVKEAISVSLQRDLGLEYFNDPEERLRKLAESEATQSTGWKEVDELLNGGIVRRQMLLFSANSGGGKSIVMANLGLNLTMQGLDVLYISLELSEEMVSLRYDSMVTGVGQAGWKFKITEIATKVMSANTPEMGNIYIKYMNAGSTSNDIKSYLKEFELQHGKVPDAIIVDYLDLVGSNEYVSLDNVFMKDKLVSEQLRNIANDCDAFIITASQQNRTAVGVTDLDHSHIAGGISKINTTDVYITIILTPSMKASGNITFQFLKTRSSDGVGKNVYLNWDGTSLRITDPGKPDNDPFNLKKESAENNTKDILSGVGDGKRLIDLIK